MYIHIGVCYRTDFPGMVGDYEYFGNFLNFRVNFLYFFLLRMRYFITKTKPKTENLFTVVFQNLIISIQGNTQYSNIPIFHWMTSIRNAGNGIFCCRNINSLSKSKLLLVEILLIASNIRQRAIFNVMHWMYARILILILTHVERPVSNFHSN